MTGVNANEMTGVIGKSLIFEYYDEASLLIGATYFKTN